MLKGPRQQQKARRWGGDGEDWDVTAARVAGSMAWRQAGSAGRGFILKPAWARTKVPLSSTQVHWPLWGRDETIRFYSFSPDAVGSIGLGRAWRRDN